MTRFLVNNLSEDGLIGETTQVSTIFHNLSIIGHGYKEAFLIELKECRMPYIVQICICGRFVTYIEVKSDLKEGSMRFYDLRNDNDLALDAAHRIRDAWFTSYYFKWFMEEFERLKEVYQDNYDAAELVLVENVGLVLN